MDNIENKVAFGMVFDDSEMNALIHGVPLPPGCVRVSVDGDIQPNALVPVPVPGEIEKVYQAVGSQVAWPRDLIIFTNVAVAVCIATNQIFNISFIIISIDKSIENSVLI